ncbi:MAG TPA: hypothetical protein VLG46_00400 [Anaerolineae bacterium]|nr:hypothetical protein [Anaerolineae bacterium]
MKRYLILIALVILAAAATSVWAQAETPVAPNADYEITWHTIDGGGGTVRGGVYILDGTVGQADAGTLGGGSYTLDGGYWNEGATIHRVFLPLVLK